VRETESWRHNCSLLATTTCFKIIYIYIFFNFHNWKILKFGNVNTLRAQLIFPSKPNFWEFFGISSNKIHSKINIFHTSGSENCEIKLIKSDLTRAFQQHQQHLQIPMQFSVSILFNFHWENGSIISHLSSK